MSEFDEFDAERDEYEPDFDVDLYYHDSEAWPNPKNYPKDEEDEGPIMQVMKTPPGRALELIRERKGFDRHIESINQPIQNPTPKQQTAAGLNSVGLSYDHLTDLSEDMDFLLMNETEIMDLKNQIAETVAEKGPEKSIETADEMLLEGRLSEQAYRIITRLIRMDALKPSASKRPQKIKQ